MNKITEETMENRRRVAGLVQQWMNERSYTIQNLAEESRLHPSTISAVLNCHRDASPKFIRVVSSVFEKDPAAIQQKIASAIRAEIRFNYLFPGLDEPSDFNPVEAELLKPGVGILRVDVQRLKRSLKRTFSEEIIEDHIKEVLVKGGIFFSTFTKLILYETKEIEDREAYIEVPCLPDPLKPLSDDVVWILLPSSAYSDIFDWISELRIDKEKQ